MSKSEDLKLEMARRQGVRARMLMAFKRDGELTTKELQRFGTGCSSRIFELRRDGHKIPSQYVSPGNYRYIYLGKDEDGDASVSVVE